jgi:hypothetical protein
MPGTNFSQFHTFKWVTIPGGVHPNQIVEQEIHAVASQLTAKGLTETNADNADLYVGYQAAVEQEKQWNAYGMGGGWRLGGGMATASSSTISNGTLVIDMYEPANKQLVWTGRGTKTLSPSKNQQKNMNNLNKAIAKVMKNYPPPMK